MASTSAINIPHGAIDLDVFLLFKSHIFLHEVCESVSVSSCQQQPSTFEPKLKAVNSAVVKCPGFIVQKVPGAGAHETLCLEATRRLPLNRLNP